jgi:hypothetical protein
VNGASRPQVDDLQHAERQALDLHYVRAGVWRYDVDVFSQERPGSNFSEDPDPSRLKITLSYRRTHLSVARGCRSRVTHGPEHESGEIANRIHQFVLADVLLSGIGNATPRQRLTFSMFLRKCNLSHVVLNPILKKSRPPGTHRVSLLLSDGARQDATLGHSWTARGRFL